MRSLVNASMEIKGEFDCSVEGLVTYSVDKSYGEDADGHRAISRTFVEDVEDICAFNVDGEEVQLDLDTKEKAAIRLTDKFLEG